MLRIDRHYPRSTGTDHASRRPFGKGAFKAFTILAMGISAVLSGCTTGPGLNIPQPGEDGQDQLLTLEELVSQSPTQTLANYNIRAGDLISVKFAFNTDLDREIRVQADGEIADPLLGRHRAAGMTPFELERRLRAVAAVELRDPELVVQVTNPVNRQIYVGGEVVSPTALDFHDNLSPIQAVTAAGGFTTGAKPDEVVLIRRASDGRPLAARINLGDLFSSSSPMLVLQPEDVLYVPRDPIEKANLWVKRYLRDLLLVSGIGFSYRLDDE